MELKPYIFTINTRDGISVPNLRVLAYDYETAEEKIKSMYRYCEIMESEERPSNQKSTMDFDEILDLVVKSD